MKIVYYLPSLQAPGGLERIITFKANYFAEQIGYEVTIVTSEQMNTPPHFPLSNKVKHIDLNVPFDVPYNQLRLTKLLKYPFRYYKFKKKFTTLLKKLQPDITISTLRRELRFINNIKDGSIKIGEFHITRYSYGVEASQNSNRIPKFLKNKWNSSFIKQLSRLSQLIILTHEGAKDWPELNNITVIPNPISTPIIEKKADHSNQQVIAAGRYATQKGFDMLISAWKIVTNRYPTWELRIYGEGDLRNKLQNQIDSLGLSNNCFLEHTVSNIAEKYCESSIYVMSSRWEGFGLVLIEAMTYGLPCVSFDCKCGPSDIIKNEENGILVENGNIEMLAEKICYLIENEDIRIKMGQKARESAKRYLPEQIMPQWETLFKSLLSSQKL